MCLCAYVLMCFCQKQKKGAYVKKKKTCGFCLKKENMCFCLKTKKSFCLNKKRVCLKEMFGNVNELPYICSCNELNNQD